MGGQDGLLECLVRPCSYVVAHPLTHFAKAMLGMAKKRVALKGSNSAAKLVSKGGAIKGGVLWKSHAAFCWSQHRPGRGPKDAF